MKTTTKAPMNIYNVYRSGDGECYGLYYGKSERSALRLMLEDSGTDPDTLEAEAFATQEALFSVNDAPATTFRQIYEDNDGDFSSVEIAEFCHLDIGEGLYLGYSFVTRTA